MKFLLPFLLLAVVTAWCAETPVGADPIDKFIVGEWRQKNQLADIDSWTEFRSNGEVLVFYVGGTNLKRQMADVTIGAIEDRDHAS